MDKHQFELLDQVKLRFLTSRGDVDFQTSKNGPNESARQFYLDHLKDNLIRPMHEDHITEYSRFRQMMPPLERLFLLTTDASFEIEYLPADKLIARLAYSPQERSLLDRYL